MGIEIENIGEYLKCHSIKPSYQRMKVFQYLYEERNHPTVDMIYKALCTEIPTLSKTTVYNTLNLFIEKEIANVIVIEENETRYDIDMTVHGHFKCEKCGKLIHLHCEDVVKLEQHLMDSHGFRMDPCRTVFYGICEECRGLEDDKKETETVHIRAK